MITREYIAKRITELTDLRAQHLQEAAKHQTMGHTLNGAIQDAQHMLDVFDGKVPAVVEASTAAVATDVVMDADVKKAEGVN